MDFKNDALANGAKIRALTAFDVCTLGRVALIAAKWLSGSDVAELPRRGESRS